MDMKSEVVISGVGGWFPGSHTLSELGQHLLDNQNLVQPQHGRWKKNEALGEEPLFGSFGDYGDFDHSFFGMHQKLAYWTDPAARLCIERSFEAIIDAGLSPRELKGSKTNVYVSSTFNDFEALMVDHFEAPSGYAIAGMSRTMIPNRISYFYDLKGQSCGFDGNWPWGQLGLQMALDAIRNGYCESALVIGSSVVHRPERTLHSRSLGLISEDGLCRSFDVAASGGQRSDAVVCFVVQRADRAKRCYARVLDSMCGVAGPLNGDPALHNPRGIERLLRAFYEDCGEDPDKVVYLEADGSGCKLWEEAEMQASSKVLVGSGREQPLLLGSVKSNVGHTDGCAGMLAVTKLILAMEAGVIPATINHDVPNPNIACLADGSVKVVTSNTSLDVQAGTLMAATTLGLGGTVGHVLLKPNAKQKQAVDPSGAGYLPRIVTVSGRTEEGVLAALQQVQSQPFDPEYLRLVQDAFSDIRGHTIRGYTIVPPLPDQAPVYNIDTAERRPLVFIFSGMGSQWPGMGRDLMQIPVFGDTIERLHVILSGKGLNLKRIITDEDPHAFDDIMNSFVGITAIQIALTNVMDSVRLSPDLMIGHSLGELACGYADGCLTEEQTIVASYMRGKAATEANLIKGMMAAVGVGYQQIKQQLPTSLDVACHNSSSSCTLAGPAEDVREFVDQLTAAGVFARAVNASDIAFHSRYVRPAAPLVYSGLLDVIPAPRPRSARWLSTSIPEERWQSPEARLCSPEYQTNNLLNPVLFEEALSHVPQDAVLLELAPHGLLQAILKRALPDHAHLSLTQRGSASGLHCALQAIGRMYSHGINPVVSALYPSIAFPVSRGTPSLAPLVSWNHSERNTFIDRPLPDCKTTFVSTVTADSPYMDLAGTAYRPVSEFIMDILAGYTHVMGRKTSDAPVILRDVHIVNLVTNPSSGERRLTTSFLLASGRFEMTDSEGRLLLSGLIRLQQDDDCKVSPRPADDAVQPGGVWLPGEVLYSELRARGAAHSLQPLRSVRVGAQPEWEAAVKSPAAGRHLVTQQLQAQLEAALQVLQLAALEDGLGISVPHLIKRLDVHHTGSNGSAEVCLRYSRATGYIEADNIRLEGGRMRPLEGAATAIPARVSQDPNSLEMTVIATSLGEEGVLQCGVVGVAAESPARLMALARGPGAAVGSRIRVDPRLAWPLPEGWSTEQAAAVPAAYCTAQYALRVLARAVAGESLLVHEGMSPLGQAAIRVALRIGCDPIYTTVRTPEERQNILDLFPQLRPLDVLSLEDFEWRLRLRVPADGPRGGAGVRGVSVGVGAVCGETFKASLRCMAFWGRYVHCAPHRMATASIGMNKFLESLTVMGCPEGRLLDDDRNPAEVSEAMRSGLQDGTVRPIAGVRQQPEGQPQQQTTPERRYLIVGGSPLEWLQVAGSLASLGVHSVAVLSPPWPSSLDALVQHRLLALQDKLGVRVVVRRAEVDAEAVRDMLPLGGVLVLARGRRDAALPRMVREALPAGVPVLACVADGHLDLAGVTVVRAPVHRVAPALRLWLAGGRPSPALPIEQAEDEEEVGERASRRLLSSLPPPTRNRGSSVVRLRPVASRCGTAGRGYRSRSCSRSRSYSRSREVFPLLALPPLGLPPQEKQAEALQELAGRLMLPVLAVEVGEGDVGQQARAVVEAVRALPGPLNLLGWGASTPLALQVARQLELDHQQACTFLLDGDVHAVTRWAARLAEDLATRPPDQYLRAALSNLGSSGPHVPPKAGRVIVLRGSNKERVSLEGLANVEVHTVRPPALDSPEVAAVINSAAAWSRMASESSLRCLRDASHC